MNSARNWVLSSNKLPDCVLDRNFLEDLQYWIAADPRVVRRILQLMEAVLREPFSGIGKPEPIKHLAADTWSRRITQEHRLVYRVYTDRIAFLQARHHY